MSRKTLLILIVAVFTGAWPLIANNVKTPVKKAPAPAVLRATPAQEEAARYISQYLLENHYRKVAVGDSLSQEVFSRYMDNLDGNRSYFLAGEVEYLRNAYGNRIDDDFLSGRPTSGFAIYNRFLKRAYEKMRYMRAAADTVKFNFAAPETLAVQRKDDPWPRTRGELTSLWRKELKYQWLNLKYSGESPKTIRTTLAKSFTSRMNLLRRQKPEDAFHAYTYALTTSFDPHTDYFSPDEYENFQIDMSRSLEGIGAKLQTESEYTIVNEVIPGGPAYRSNLLKKGDKIIGVGQGRITEIVDVVGWRINDVVKLIRGKKGTVVRIKILPASQAGRGPAKVIMLTRDKVDLEEQAAHKTIIQQNGKKIGVITIPSFYLDFEAQKKNDGSYNSTSRDVARILGELSAAAVDGVVIDLRDNGGGSLEEAVNVTGLFITTGPVVQISNSTGGKMVLRDEDRQMTYPGPLVVLVNRYSASASEIFAAAIQDYGRGVVVGERTFGKGTVQSIINLQRPYSLFPRQPNLGQMKLTIAKFYRISGESTQHKGVVPDITIPSLIDATAIGEDTYTSSLPWSTVTRTLYRPIDDVMAPDILLLRQKFQSRALANRRYQSYLTDLAALNRIRKKKSVSLKESSFRLETEKIKQIEKLWSTDGEQEPAAKKTPKMADVVLNEAAVIATDLAVLEAARSQTIVRRATVVPAGVLLLKK
ncbi:MAG: tail-specific protease [Pelodictyon luteolum]|uniref:Tail-specific protease n=1 Tax=Pelodictyon luteolum TaxID=1100 RepID=A0A165LPD6_PELLU|nr:carboxy terminal-processing peptidase [Pelodictyon luteolum]KZK74262.1 MAG: tail-specific protease [Pelodictyon luteolum]